MNNGNDLSPASGLVSVIVPLYNNATSICRCVDSILNQTYKQVEILVIDDGSTDSSLDVISHYGDKIILLRQENKGPAAARNFGIKNSSGEFLSFLDSDDYWHPTFLEKTISILRVYPQAIAASTATKAINWKGKEVIIPANLFSPEFDMYKKGGGVIADFFNFWAKNNHITTGSVLIHAGLLHEPLLQREDLRISEDLEYWGMLATYGEWVFLPEILFITDGTPNAAVTGWLNKNRARRRQCPSIETWQSRLEPRLKLDALEGFKAMRGLVASTFAYAKILGGGADAALETVLEYGAHFPVNSITRLMKIGLKGGALGWWLTCKVIILREILKSYYLAVKFRFP